MSVNATTQELTGALRPWVTDLLHRVNRERHDSLLKSWPETAENRVDGLEVSEVNATVERFLKLWKAAG